MKMECLDINAIVNEIEIESDEIVRHIEINDVSEEALRRIKKSVLSIRKAVSRYTDENKAVYMTALQRVLNYLKGAVINSFAIESYADRIQGCIENYIIHGKPYDEAYELGRDKELESFVKAKRVAIRISDVANEMKALVEQKITYGYDSDSLEYKMILTRYNDLQNQFNIYSGQLDDLQIVIRQNAIIRQAVEKSISLSDVTTLGTMSLEEYSVLAYSNKEKANQARGLLNAFESIASDVAAPVVSMEKSEASFRRAVEDTLLERMYKQNADKYGEQIVNMPKAEYNNAILQLIRRLGKLEESIEIFSGQEKYRAEETKKQIDALLSRTEDLATFREDVSGDIAKEVEYCLARTPADIAGANLKIRNCIELYCRFEKGVDLNDRLFFAPGEKVRVKMEIANIDDHLEEIIKMYGGTNKYIHNDYTVLDLTADEKEMEANRARRNVAKLKEWGLDAFDVNMGLQRFYLNQDNQLVKMIEDGRMNKKFFDAERKEKIFRYFERMTSIRNHLKVRGLEIPTVRFASDVDLEKYFNGKENTTSLEAVMVSKPEKIEAEKKSYTPSNGSDVIYVGTITYIDDRGKTGKIDDKLFFIVPTKYGNPAEYVKGARVSYKKGIDKNNREFAKSMRVISALEVTT